MSSQPLAVQDYSNEQTVASTISNHWFEWNNYRVNARNLWGEIDSYIHATDTTSTLYNETDHKTMIPIVSEIHEDLNAIMYGTVLPHEDWLGWKGYDSEGASADKRRKVLGYLKQLHSMNGLRTTVRRLLDDYSRYGNAFCMVKYEDRSIRDEDGNIISGFSGAVPKRISPYDIVFNPTATSFEQSAKVVKEMMSIGEFVQWTDNLANTEVQINQEAVDRIKKARDTGQRQADPSNQQKNNQYLPDGFGTIEQYYTSGFVEVLWFYGSMYDVSTGTVHHNRCIPVIDREEMLFNEQVLNPRIFKASWKPRPDNLWAQGALDNILGINYMVNHRENSKNDAIDRFVTPDKAFVGQVDEVYDEVTGQTKYVMPEGGSVTEIRPDSTILSYNSEIDMHLELARRAARLPQQLSGFKTPGEKTAFEVQALNDGAFRGFINKAEQFEQDVLEQLVTAEIDIARENFESVLKVMAEDDEGIQRMIEVTRDDLRVNGKLIPYGARRFARSLQQQAGLNQLANSNLFGIVAPHAKSWNIAQAVNQTYGFEDFGMFGKFASIEEQQEAQEMQQVAAEQAINEFSQPSMTELEMEQMEDEDV